MNSYEERRQRRADRLRSRAAKARAEASSRFDAAREIQSHIPFGQPIMVGHHSEKRHRSDLQKIDRHMANAVAATDLAKHYERAAEAAGNNTSISSDDPEAIDKLREKLAGLVERQDRMKAVNAAYRAWKKRPETLSENTSLTEVEKALVRTFVPRFAADKGPYAAYELTNNNANIARVRDRIAALEARGRELERLEAETGSSKVTTDVGEGYQIIEDHDDNRLLIVFDAKPPDSVREKLRRSGFRWSPNRGAWCRLLTNAARYASKHFLS